MNDKQKLLKKLENCENIFKHLCMQINCAEAGIITIKEEMDHIKKLLGLFTEEF